MSLPAETNRTGQIIADPAEVQWLEAAATDGATPRLRRFQMTAYTGGPMQLQGWRYPVVVDLAGLQASSKPKVFLEHERTSRVGHIDQVQASESNLMVAGVISASGKAAQEVLADAANGFPWQASIGARATKVEWVPEGMSARVNGRVVQGPVNIARQSVLGEVSFVALGADDATAAQIAAQQIKENPLMEVTMPLNTNSETPASATAPTAPAPAPVAAPVAATPAAPAVPAPAVAPVTAAPATPALPTADELVAAALQKFRDTAAAEAQRLAAIRTICQEAGGKAKEIEAQAIAEGWDLNRTKLEVLRIGRQVELAAPTILVPAAPEAAPARVLEAACYQAGRMAGAEKLFDTPTLEAADKKFHGAIGLQELILEAAWANGYTGRNFRDARHILRFAFQPEMCGGLSHVDVGGILSNVANKFLLEGFFSVERTWRNLCAVRNVSDFKAITSYRLIGADQYELVNPGGELKHGSLGQESYSNKADTYGLMLGIDRRDIINDDLGAITTVPRKLGRGSGLKINDVFWATFLANSEFFAAGNTNYLTGTDTVLGIDGLSKAEVAFLDQVDPEGKPIGILPAILLVPTALSAVGTQLFKSMDLRDTTANAKYPINNPHQGKFRVEVSRYLANSQYNGYSSKAWYLLADPNDLPVIEVAFLNGQESPTIETAEADFNVLGIQMRGYHDFGVALQDPRGGIKSKGEA